MHRPPRRRFPACSRPLPTMRLPAATATAPAPAVTTPIVTPPPATTTTTTDTTTTGAHHMSHGEIQRIQKQEVIRRQELVYRADQETSQGRKDELGQRYPSARAHYLFAVQAYGSVNRNTSHYRYAAAGLERVDSQLIEAARQAGDTPRIKMLADEIVTVQSQRQGCPGPAGRGHRRDQQSQRHPFAR